MSRIRKRADVAQKRVAARWFNKSAQLKEKAIGTLSHAKTKLVQLGCLFDNLQNISPEESVAVQISHRLSSTSILKILCAKRSKKWEIPLPFTLFLSTTQLRLIQSWKIKYFHQKPKPKNSGNSFENNF